MAKVLGVKLMVINTPGPMTYRRYVDFHTNTKLFASSNTPPQCTNDILHSQRLLYNQDSPVSHLALVQFLHALLDTLSCHRKRLNDRLDLVMRSEC